MDRRLLPQHYLHSLKFPIFDSFPDRRYKFEQHNLAAMNAKKIAAEKAVEQIENNMIVGLGTGSTASYAIRKIGERVGQGLDIKAVATSIASEKLAMDLNIPIIPIRDVAFIDIAIDGADEVDAKGNLIKGGGGALLREKIVAFASKQFHVIVDQSKLTELLGKFPLPVEIVPFATRLTIKHLEALGCEPSIRKVKTEDFITDNGNLVVDCRFEKMGDPEALDAAIKKIPGVVETGLFPHTMVTSVIVGHENGLVSTLSLRT
jgi:ribose 5-phosphate isomerase A